MPIKRAACYIRVSTDDQVEYSPDSQLREMREYAAHNGILILENHIYVDDGISGREAKKRPRFQEMIAMAKTSPKPFDMLLLYKFSRFARNREDSVVYKSLLRKKCKIDVISIKEPLDPDNKMSIIMEAFIEAMDEYYSINLSEDVKRTMTEKAMRGELQSSPSFGYNVKDNVLVPIEREAKLVQLIFQKFVSGDGYTAIAKWLNAMGIVTHRGNRFENRTVEYIIRNPVYIGKLRWNPAGRSRRHFDDPHIILSDAKHKPIIDNETWENAQKRVAQLKFKWRNYRRPDSEHKDWLSGLIMCSECGKTLVKATDYWRCNGYVKGTCLKSQSVKDDIIKKAVLERMAKDIESEGVINFTVITTSKKDDELEVYSNQLSGIPQKMQRAREAYLNGADTLDEYKKNKQLITDEKNLIEKRIDAISVDMDITANTAKMKSALADAYKILTDPKSDMKTKHKASHNIFHHMVYDKDKNLLKIEYKLYS